MARFTQDWTSNNTDNWRQLLARFAGVPKINALEIGCFEGRSALWFLENVLTHKSSRITCIDPHLGPLFEENIRPFRRKVNRIKGYSGPVLRKSGWRPETFHFIYIDGSHKAPDVLEDAVLSFPLLAPGGIMIFDDYRWVSDTPELPESMPAIGIDAFLSAFRGRLRVLDRGWQVAVTRL